MEFENPRRDSNGNIYIEIQVFEPLKITYTALNNSKFPTPLHDSKELISYVREISKVYETYSTKWFSTTTTHLEFLQNVENFWKYDTSLLPSQQIQTSQYNVHQIWKPNTIHFAKSPSRYVITWILYSVNYLPIKTLELLPGREEDISIPYAEDGSITQITKAPRTAVKERIRRARIKATAYNLKLAQLLESYYEKYGSLEHIDKDSPLSSDLDSNIE
jgi:hypothetical protein